MHLSAHFCRDFILLIKEWCTLPHTTRPYELKILKYKDLKTDNGQKCLIL